MNKTQLNKIANELASDAADFAAEDLGGDSASVFELSYVLMMLGRQLTQMGADLCTAMPKDFQEDMEVFLKK
jgi:hypothetical protein